MNLSDLKTKRSTINDFISSLVSLVVAVFQSLDKLEMKWFYRIYPGKTNHIIIYVNRSVSLYYYYYRGIAVRFHFNMRLIVSLSYFSVNTPSSVYRPVDCVCIWHIQIKSYIWLREKSQYLMSLCRNVRNEEKIIRF